MPVTARLSKAFYDQFGEQVTNELVGWFNDVDATYRSDLKEMNELNFARFDANVGQRFARQDARIDQRFAEQETKIDQRFAEQETKIDQRFALQEAKIDQRFALQETKIDQRFAASEARTSERLNQFESRLNQLFTLVADQQRLINDRFDAQTRWLIGVLLTQMAAILGIISVVVRR